MAGHHGGFGTTMLIMQPKGICGTYSVTEGAKDLVQHYNDNLEALGLEKDSKDLKCDRAWS